MKKFYLLVALFVAGSAYAAESRAQEYEQIPPAPGSSSTTWAPVHQINRPMPGSDPSTWSPRSKKQIPAKARALPPLGERYGEHGTVHPVRPNY